MCKAAATSFCVMPLFCLASLMRDAISNRACEWGILSTSALLFTRNIICLVCFEYSYL